MLKHVFYPRCTLNVRVETREDGLYSVIFFDGDNCLEIALTGEQLRYVERVLGYALPEREG
ncbi:MAG: hypothetical protein WC381_10740 [Kiritimatiellia bacterium]|jgi:hypothetical protein